MLHRSFKPAKCKTSCKLAKSRLKLMKNKKGVQLNQMKRDLAQLLESGQDQTARIRVEHVIREEKTIAAYDLIEIYCELIVARMPIIESQKNCPIDLKEAVTSVIFASPRCADIPELHDIKKHLAAKYGKEFTSAAVELRPDCGVSRMLIEKLSAVAPDGPTKIKVLKAIAEEHNIEWEPKAFGEKDAKPPDDLLNGPTTFEKASTMNVEPPKFQAPPSQDQKHQEPSNYYEQNKRFSMGSQDFTSTDSGGNKSSSGTSHPEVRPDIRPESRNSGMGSERMEVRQSFHGDGNGRPNWNMGFKDATSAAQAAAESAEMASMAARAAAELSSQGRITRQYSSESQKTSTRDSRDERQEHHAKAPTNRSFHDRNPNFSRQHSPESQKSHMRNERLEKHVASNLSVEKDHAKETVNQSFHDRNPNINRQYSTESRKSNIDGLRHERSPKLQNERVEKQEYDNLERAAEKFHADGHRSAKRSSPSASSRSSKALIDDDTLLNSIAKGEGYSRKSSFEEEADKVEKVEPLSGRRQDSFESESSNPFGGERIEKQFSSGSPHSRSRTFSDGYTVSDSKIDATEDPSVVIDQGSIRRDAVNPKPYDDDDEVVAFDEYSSGESSRSIDIEPTYEVESTKSYFPSPDRKLSMEIGPTYDEVESTKSYFPSPDRKPSMERSTSDDFGSVTFDYSAGPKFDSEDEFEKSSRNEQKGSSILVEQTNSGFDRRPRFELDDVRSESSVFEPINTFSHEVEENSSSGSETGTELKFGMLKGGLRNKVYRRPPYTTSPSNDASSSFKKSAESSSPIDQTAPVTVRSSFNSRVNRNADEKLSSTVATAVSDSDSDDSREEFPQQNPKVNTKLSLKSRVTTFDQDSADSGEDLREQTPANRSRFGSGLSRRTKATPSSSGSRVRLGAESQTQTEPRSQARGSGQWGAHEEPSSEKEATAKGSFNTPEPRSQTRNSGQLSLEKRADPKPTNEPKAPEGPRSQTNRSSQWGNKDQLGSEKHALSKPVTEPKVESFKAAEPRTRTPISKPKAQSYEGSSKVLAAEQPSRARLAADRTDKEVASKPVSKPTRESIRSSEERSEASISTVASSTVAESGKKSSSPLSREDSSGTNSGGGASHVHPKLPDYDDVFAHFQALRENRK